MSSVIMLISMKKVLFVITKSNWGGAQRYVYDLAVNLPKENFAVKVALGGNGILKERLEEAKIEIVPIPHLQRDINTTREILSLFSLIKIFSKEKPDIIHLNSSKAGGLGAMAALLHKLWTKNYKLKTIFTVHGWAFNEARTFRAKSLIYLSQWLTSLLCRKIIILSRHDYRQALGMPLIPKTKFALIPLGIPENNLDFATKQSARKQLLLPPTAEEIYVGTIAEFTKNKGLDYLLDAMNTLKSQNLHLAIVGDGEDKENIEQRIKNEEIKNVKTCGFVPHAAKYIKAFDIFVLPSLKEGLPYTILEAMNAGVPVVASSVGGIPDLIEHEKSGYLTIPRNPASLAESLGKLISSEKTRRQFSRESRVRALEKFSFGSMLSRTIKLYEI